MLPAGLQNGIEGCTFSLELVEIARGTALEGQKGYYGGMEAEMLSPERPKQRKLVRILSRFVC